MADALGVALADRLGQLLRARSSMLALAESCTGGGVAELVTSVAGSSAWFERGFVTYSNTSKIEMLGVSARTLEEYGAVSLQTVREMAAGALARSHAQAAIAISGIAGPDGGSLEKPVGTVCFAWAMADGTVEVERRLFSGDRAAIRMAAAHHALARLAALCERPG